MVPLDSKQSTEHCVSLKLCYMLSYLILLTLYLQLATAFDALKSIRVIHTDVKPDNIMVVNRWTRPLRVKLIDFGLAMPAAQARTGMRLQTVYFR